MPTTARARRLRVLAVTSEPPWPLNSGGHIRSFHLLTALANETDLRLVCPVQPDQEGAVEPLRARGVNMIPVPVGPRTKLSEARRLLGAVLRGEPYVMYRRHAWPDVAAAWDEHNLIDAADVWYLDHIDSLMYHVPWKPAPPPTVIDLHNVYSLLTRRTADEQRSWIKRAFLRRESRLLDRMERAAARTCDALFTVSDQEAEHFRQLGAKSVHVIPNGVDCGALADLPTGRSATSPPTVLFLGTMSWGPNANVARFLIDIMPELRARIPDVVVLIVGRDPPADLLAMNGRAGVEVTGGVPDVKPYLARASLMAVPLDAGGGTRLKILEAFAAGLPVVSTAIGAEGIEAVPGTHLVIAERPNFVDAIVKALTSGTDQMAVCARELARDVYDWSRIGAQAARAVIALGSGSV